MTPPPQQHAWPAGRSYSQWLKDALQLARNKDSGMVGLFDSSTEEPSELLCRTVSKGFSSGAPDLYAPVFSSGNRHLIDSLAKRYATPREGILTSAGATDSLNLIFRALLRPGDDVLIETPGFDLFGEIVSSLGARAVYVSREGPEAVLKPEAFARSLTPRTRAIIISNIHNPTGGLASPEAIKALADIAEGASVPLIVDEVYGEFTSEDAPFRTAAALSPAIVAVNSLTKVYGLSALRCGWLIGDPDRLGTIRTAHERLGFNTSKLGHAVAAMVLRDPEPFEAHWRSRLAGARPVVESYLEAWRLEGLIEGQAPRFGCIAFPRLTGVADTAVFADWLAREHGVIVAPGRYFGAPGHIRVGFSRAPEGLDLALARLGRGLRAYVETHAGDARPEENLATS